MSALNSEVKASLEANNAAFERLRADMANQKVWLFALVFGAVVTGITLGLALSGSSSGWRMPEPAEVKNP